MTPFPATFIDQGLLVEQVDLGVFGKHDMEVAERRVLALFKLTTKEGDQYALTVVYIPYKQKQMAIQLVLPAVHTTIGNAVALVGMPKDFTKCAYMPEPANGEHYTLLLVCGNTEMTFGPVGDFAAAVLTKGSTHYRINQRVVVKLPGSFTRDTTFRGLVDEEVFDRGSIWTNNELVEMEADELTPVVVNGRTFTMEREIFVSNTDVYTNTSAFQPLTLVTCEPGFEPGFDEYTETVAELQARVEKEMDEQRGALREDRHWQLRDGGKKHTGMDTTPAPPNPAVIPGTDLHIVTPEGVTMEDFSKTGQVVMDLTESTDDKVSTGNGGGQAANPQGGTGGRLAGAEISDEELSARLMMFKYLDAVSRDQSILEDGYFKCVEAVRKVVKDVSADLDEMENAYVAAVMRALAKWQESGAEALQAMHTADAKEWDKLHTKLIQATAEFRNECLEAETTETKGLTEVMWVIASGARKDPAIEILDLASQRTRKIIDNAAEEYLKALKDCWLDKASLEQLPTLVASTPGVLMTFRMAVWRLISDESVWPSRLRSAGFCKMAPIVRQSLATIPALCSLVVPPRPSEVPAPPPSPMQTYLMKQAKVSASPQVPPSGYGSGSSMPAGTPTAPRRSFGTLPQPGASPMGPPVTTQPLPR